MKTRALPEKHTQKKNELMGMPTQDAAMTHGDGRPEQKTPDAFTFSDGFFDWLTQERISVLVSTYQASCLLSIGALDGAPWIRQSAFSNCMGFYHRDGVLVAGTDNRIVLMNHLQGDLEADHFEAGTDRVFYPRMAWVTGRLNVHDMVWTDAGQLVFVNTAFDCLATVDPTYSFMPLWQPDFLADKDPSARDCCHLNGLCLQDGEVAWVTALGKSAQAGGWRAQKASGGLLFDVRSGDLLCDTLSMPHSPRWHDGHLWLLNSGTGEFGRFDLEAATFEPVAFCPGFARGLAFHRHWALITLSDMRRANGFQGLALEEQLHKRGVRPGCGLLVVNTRTGGIEHWLSVKGTLREFYDVSVLAGVSRPSIINMEQAITKDIHLPPPAATFRAPSARPGRGSMDDLDIDTRIED